MPLIGQTTRHSPDQESVIASGIPELTTDTCAEVGACIGGHELSSREQATLPHTYYINGYRRLEGATRQEMNAEAANGRTI